MSRLQRSTTTTRLLLLFAAGAAALVSACGRGNDDDNNDARIARQEVARTAPNPQTKAAVIPPQAMPPDADAGKEAAAALTIVPAPDAGANKTEDAAITATIKGELAKDRQLSRQVIDVDTAGGRVLLHGSAPDAVACERATRLAASIDGVRSVDNLLTVVQKG